MKNKNARRDDREIICTCLHELGHGIALARQGYGLKSITVNLRPKNNDFVAGQCVTTAPHCSIELFCQLGFSVADLHDIALAQGLRKTVIKNSDLRGSFLPLLKNGLVVAQSGIVAEVLLYGVFADLGMMAISDAMFVDLIAEKTQDCFGQGQITNEFFGDEAAIEFMLAAHPGKGVMKKIIKRIIRELRDERVAAVVKKFVPKLLLNGKLSKTDLRAIETAFQPA